VLLNPFTPTEIASQPDDFFGRIIELETLERSLAKGSVVIQGPIGIGKSSLMARARLHMEGFDSEQRAASIVLVGNKAVQTLDDAARCLVQELVTMDEQKNTIKFSLGKLFEIENSEAIQNYRDKHHLAVAMRILKQDYLTRVLDDERLLIIAIDEADKCPVPLAQMLRALVTHAQQNAVRGLRFLVSGVSPFFEQMLQEDNGIARFFYKSIVLEPLVLTEAHNLIAGKLRVAADDAFRRGLDLRIDPIVIDRVVAISGGHPHLLQLLGSHLIEDEDSDPDGVIDTKDLYGSLRRICYEDRSSVYNSILHELELYNHLDSFYTLLGQSQTSPLGIIKRGFPTQINRQLAQTSIGPSELSWFVTNNILRATSPDYYGLVDEFLRVRILLDQADSENDRELTEQGLLNGRLRLEY